MNNVNVKNQSVAYQGFFIRCVMLFLPFLFSMTPVLLHVNGKSLEILSMVGLGLGSVIVLLLVSFQNKIISRLLLAINIYWLMLSVSNLLFGQLQFRYSYSYIALLGVALYTIKYSEYGFIGKQYKDKTNITRASYLLLGLWILGLIASNIKHFFTGFVATGLNFGSGLSDCIFLRFIILHLFDETKKEPMRQRIMNVVFGIVFFFMAVPYAYSFLDKKNTKNASPAIENMLVEEQNSTQESFNKKIQKWLKTF